MRHYLPCTLFFYIVDKIRTRIGVRIFSKGLLDFKRKQTAAPIARG